MAASRREFLKVLGIAGVGVTSNIFTWQKAMRGIEGLDDIRFGDDPTAFHMVRDKYRELYKGQPLNWDMVAHVDRVVRKSVLRQIGIGDKIKALDLELDVVTLRPDQLLYGFLRRHELKNENDDNRYWIVGRLIDGDDWAADVRAVQATGLIDKRGLRQHGYKGWVHDNALIATIPKHLEV